MTTPDVPSQAPTRKQRGWLFYTLVGVGGFLLLAIVLAVILGVAAFAYARSMVTTYTTTNAQALPKAPYDPQAQKQRQKEFEKKWAEFGKAVMNRQNPPPFEITADDINNFFAQNQGIRDHARFVITNDQLVAQFTLSGEETRQKWLKGRFVNGTAPINIVFKDGWLTVNVGKVEANGKPLPGWMLKRFQGENITKDLDRNRDFVNLMQEIERIEVKDGHILVTPAK